MLFKVVSSARTLSLIVSALLAMSGSAAAHPPQGDLTLAASLASDTLGQTLRASGRAHIYLIPGLECTADSPCPLTYAQEAGEVFRTRAVAAPAQPGQRWPTLCDNSAEVRLLPPRVEANVIRIPFLVSHAVRDRSQLSSAQHMVSVFHNGARWSVVDYQIIEESDRPDGGSAARCSWSAELSAAAADATVLPSAPLVDHIPPAETCAACRLVQRPGPVLGDPMSEDTPMYGAKVFSNGSDGFFAQGGFGARLLAFDQDGALRQSAELPSRANGDRGVVDALVVGQGDTVYVLDRGARRIHVLTPELRLARQIPLPWTVQSFWVLRDGRVVTLRDPAGNGDPIAVHSATGEILRAFGVRSGTAPIACDSCGSPLATLLPSGYRILLAWSDRYEVEEWDLSGRRVEVHALPATALDAARSSGFATLSGRTAAVRESTPHLNRILVDSQGLLWVDLDARDAQGRVARRVDVIDLARSALLKSLRDFDLDEVVVPGVRAEFVVDEFGFPAARVFRYELDR